MLKLSAKIALPMLLLMTAPVTLVWAQQANSAQQDAGAKLAEFARQCDTDLSTWQSELDKNPGSVRQIPYEILIARENKLQDCQQQFRLTPAWVNPTDKDKFNPMDYVSAFGSYQISHLRAIYSEEVGNRLAAFVNSYQLGDIFKTFDAGTSQEVGMTIGKDEHLMVPKACLGVFPDDPQNVRGTTINRFNALAESAKTVKSFSELSQQITEISQLDKAVQPFLPNINGPSLVACEQASNAERNYQGKYLGLWVAMWYVGQYSGNYMQAAYSQSDALGRLKSTAWQGTIDDYNALVAKYNALVGLARGMASFPASSYPLHTPLNCSIWHIPGSTTSTLNCN
jgi:hypothetical protein